MLRTLAFLGVAAVAYKQLEKRGSLDRFKDDLKRRTDDLRAYVDEKRAGYAPVNSDSAAGAPSPAGAGTATI